MGFKVTILGLGSIGVRHLNNILSSIDEVDKIYVYDSDQDKLNSDKLKNEKVKICSSRDKLIGHEADIAFILTPSASHFEDSLEFVKRGTPVFIEKPVTTDSGKCRELMQLCTSPIFVGCNMRYHPGVENAYKIIEKKVIGEIVYARAFFGHLLKNWRQDTDYRKSYSARKESGGGVIWDGIHELDYLLWLLGDVRECRTFFENRAILDIETEEIAEMMLYHTNRVISSIHLDYIQMTKRRGLELVGSAGTYIWNSTGKNPEFMRIEVLRGASEAEVIYSGEFKDANSAYVKEIKDIFSVLKGKSIKATKLLTIEDSCRGIEIIEGIKRLKAPGGQI